MTQMTVDKKNIILLILACVHMASVTCRTNKRRLCLSYRLGSSRADYGILDTTVASDEHRCMMNCVRHPDCWAFNFINNGTCELLPTLGECEETLTQTESVFIHLSTCDGENPQELMPRNWTTDECLMWIPHSIGSPCPPGVLKSSTNNNCFSLTPNYNLYMPGWFAPDLGFRFVTEDQRTKRCPEGYVVKVAPGCTVTWQGYSVGDPIPANATQVSVWRDGTPLYAVERHISSGGGYFIGYYLPTVQTVYIMAGRVFNPTNVRILVVNWYPYWYVIKCFQSPYI